MSTTPGTALAVIGGGADSPYELLRMEPTEVTDLVSDALAPGETLSAGDLTRIKWPGGGGTTWEIPSARGEIATKEITGVILAAHTTRGFWKNPWEGQTGEEARPDCSSLDGIVGEGDPGGVCEKCPLNEFGTAVNDKGGAGAGKGCKERRVLFVLPRDGILPYVISVPPGSLAALKSYRVQLMREKLRLQTVETTLKLEKAESQGGIAFAKLEPIMAGELDPAAQQAIAAFTALVTPSMRRATQDEAQRQDEES